MSEKENNFAYLQTLPDAFDKADVATCFDLKTIKEMLAEREAKLATKDFQLLTPQLKQNIKDQITALKKLCLLLDMDVGDVYRRHGLVRPS